jgi:hypothetical protein
VPVAGRAHVSGVSTRRLFTASMRSSPRSLRIAVNGVAWCRTWVGPDEPEAGDVLAFGSRGVVPRPEGELQPAESTQALVSVRRTRPSESAAYGRGCAPAKPRASVRGGYSAHGPPQQCPSARVAACVPVTVTPRLSHRNATAGIGKHAGRVVPSSSSATAARRLRNC